MMIFKFLKFSVLLIAMAMIILACREQPEAPWVSLFDSKTLNGWTQKGGEALYEVRKGTIVGVTVNHSLNSFLTTESE